VLEYTDMDNPTKPEMSEVGAKRNNWNLQAQCVAQMVTYSIEIVFVQKLSGRV
jgi:hypothetical protein